MTRGQENSFLRRRDLAHPFLSFNGRLISSVMRGCVAPSWGGRGNCSSGCSAGGCEWDCGRSWQWLWFVASFVERIVISIIVNCRPCIVLVYGSRVLRSLDYRSARLSHHAQKTLHGQFRSIILFTTVNWNETLRVTSTCSWQSGCGPVLSTSSICLLSPAQLYFSFNVIPISAALL